MMQSALVELVQETSTSLAHLRADELEVLLERTQALAQTLAQPHAAVDLSGVTGSHKNLGELLDVTAQSIRLLEALRLESIGESSSIQSIPNPRSDLRTHPWAI